MRHCTLPFVTLEGIWEGVGETASLGTKSLLCPFKVRTSLWGVWKRALTDDQKGDVDSTPPDLTWNWNKPPLPH